MLIFTGSLVKAQKWTPYKIDDSVQVSLPTDHKIIDTLGQTIINGSTAFGNIQVIKTPDNPLRTPEIEKEKNLNEYYKNYLQKIRNSAPQGSITGEQDTTINNLLYKEFTLQVDSGSGKQLRNFRIVHVNSATYTFEFLYDEIHKDFAGDDRNSFFNSIRIPPDATLQNQFTRPGNTTGKPPEGSYNTLIIGIAIGLAVIIVVVILVVRKRKRLR